MQFYTCSKECNNLVVKNDIFLYYSSSLRIDVKKVSFYKFNVNLLADAKKDLSSMCGLRINWIFGVRKIGS